MKKEIYNVVQWSSGNVGKASIIGINNRKDLNLSGLIVSDENKIGMDAGAIIDLAEFPVHKKRILFFISPNYFIAR